MAADNRDTAARCCACLSDAGAVRGVMKIKRLIAFSLSVTDGLGTVPSDCNAVDVIFPRGRGRPRNDGFTRSGGPGWSRQSYRHLDDWQWAEATGQTRAVELCPGPGPAPIWSEANGAILVVRVAQRVLRREARHEKKRSAPRVSETVAAYSLAQDYAVSKQTIRRRYFDAKKSEWARKVVLELLPEAAARIYGGISAPKIASR